MGQGMLSVKTGSLKIVILLASLAFFASLADAIPDKHPAPVFKQMRPERKAGKEENGKKDVFDVNKIRDPFLSYLVGKGRELAAQTEEELRRRMEAELKKAEEESILMKRRLEAQKQLMELKRPRTELQQMHIGQLVLTAIVQSKDKEWAMVRDERGRGFILKKGTLIGKEGGVVSRIAGKEKKVIIKEPYLEKGLYIKYKEVEMKLPDQVYE
jgi:hypothetical protein